MNYDDIIVKIFITDKQKINSNLIRKLNKYPLLSDYLLNRFSDSDGLYKEIIWRIYYKIENRPKCKTCGKYTKIKIDHNNKTVYKDYCGSRCAALSKERNEKYQKTCLEKYGAKLPVHNTEIHEQIVNGFIEKYGVDNPLKSSEIQQKKKDTCLKKYGVECFFNSDDFEQKAKQTKLEKYGNENFVNLDKRYETNLLKYGVKNYVETNEFKEKAKQTCLEHYGVDNYFKLDYVKEKSHSKEILHKIYLSKKQNNSFNTSQPEEKCYEILKEHYPDIIRQYTESRYPFNCDFYIPSKDLFIEYQGSWTHGFKPFEGTKEDLLKLQEWTDKNTEYYNNAINTWTVRDVNKRNIAKQNKLNYIELWTLDELKHYL